MAQNYYNNSIYTTSKGAGGQRVPPLNYEESVYSTGQPPYGARSVASGKTRASNYSQVTKKSSDFYHSDLSSDQRQLSYSQRIMTYIYNPEDGTIMSRTKGDWLKAIAYHLVMYGVVAMVWAASFGFFDFAVLDEDKPTRTGQHNALRNNPSLSYIPQPDYYTSIIRFRTSRLSSVRKYVDDLVAYTQWYEDHGLQNIVSSDESVTDCSYDKPNPDPKRTVCRFDLNVGRRCNFLKNFGFVDGDPCIALKLNRVYGWVPDPVGADNSTGVIVRCRGRTKADDDFIGRICYHYSTDGGDRNAESAFCKSDFGVFEHYYFPYLRQVRYMSPLVFVEFQGVSRNVAIMIECEAEAKNIQVDRTYRIGLAQFELMVD